MCRDPDLMQHLGHIRLQILFHVVLLVEIRLYPFHFRMYIARRFRPSAADSADLVQDHVAVERFHDIIIRSEAERILCHILTAGRRHHDKRRVVLHLRVILYLFHDRNSVKSRHDHIHEDNVRICSDDHIVCVLAIICFSNHMDPVLFLQDLAK